MFHRTELQQQRLVAMFLSKSRLMALAGSNAQHAGFHSDIHASAPVHDLHVLLHSTKKPTEVPSRYQSPLRIELHREVMRLRGLTNFSWSPTQPLHSLTDAGPTEVYHATAFSTKRGYLDIPEVSMDNLERVVALLESHSMEPLPADQAVNDDIYLYVCTHNARDCRCGEHGGAMVDALRQEIKNRKSRDPTDASHRVKEVAETQHVGGHKYAANLLIYPHGDWLGDLRVEHVPLVLDAILVARPFKPMQYNCESAALVPHWRGRMGLSKEQCHVLLGN